MKKILLGLLCTVSYFGYSQSINVSTEQYTVPQLVNDILVNSPCATVQNIQWKTGTQFESSNGIGYFTNTNPNFPMQSGVILSTGDVLNAAGPNSSMLEDGNQAWTGDVDLENTLAAAGIPMNSTNATVLEFDFIPISTYFNFDFIFASEEYGNFQCNFSDAFAFLLTNTLTGETVNLAVVPGTNTPISVATIRDYLYNSYCTSENAEYFGRFNGGSNIASSAINFNGQTTLLNASATLTAGVPYHIKLVIADRGDYRSDSAIFIDSNSLNIGQDVLGPNITIANGTAPCFGGTHILDTQLNPDDFTFVWKRNNVVIPGATAASLEINQAGTYSVTYTTLWCQSTTDTITVQFQPELQPNAPINLLTCDTGAATYTYNLEANNSVITGEISPAPSISYHASQEDADSQANALPASYTAAPGTTIFARIEKDATGCYVVRSFQLGTTNAPIAHPIADVTLCEKSLTQQFATITFSDIRSEVLNGQSASQNLVRLFLSEEEASTNTNPKTSINATNGQVIWVRVYTAADATCYAVTSFTVHTIAKPVVDILDDQVVCESYTLPALENGNYFTEDNGQGEMLAAGTVISTNSTIYIYKTTDTTPSCGNSSSFTVTIIDPANLVPDDVVNCGRYQLPGLEFGNYYNQPGGQGGQINAGSYINETRTVYYYYVSDSTPECIVDDSFEVTIVEKPVLPAFPNVYVCDSYQLPVVTIGTFYTGPGGTGDILAPGTVISTTTRLYLFTENTTVEGLNCNTQRVFMVYVGLTTPEDISQCEPYTLPEIEQGNYYTQAGGQGEVIPAGTVISESTTIYYFFQNPEEENCLFDVAFQVNINQPFVEQFPAAYACVEFILPELESGARYFTGSNMTGVEMFPGDAVTTTRTIRLIKESENGCTTEKNWTIHISQLPEIDSRDNIDQCNSYTLTPLANGQYYTGPAGTGTILPAGTVITEDTRVYIFARSEQMPYCENETFFDVLIYPLHATQLEDVTVCDSFTLPTVEAGDYYTLSGGTNTVGNVKLNAGDVITASTSLYIYIESGERINCWNETAFAITVNYTPVLDPLENVYVCDSYTLPALTVGNYFTQPNGQGTQVAAGTVLTETTTLYAYAETATTPNCFAETAFTVAVFNVEEREDVIACDSYVFPALSTQFYYTGPNGTGTRYQQGDVITQTTQIYIYAISQDGDCSDESTYTVTVVPAPVANPVALAARTFCDEDGTNDGILSIELAQFDQAIMGGQSGAEFAITYHLTAEAAANGTSAVQFTEANTVFARIVNTNAASCYDVIQLALVVNRLPEPTLVDGTICTDPDTGLSIGTYTVNSGLSQLHHSFVWKNEAGDVIGTASQITLTEVGVYTLVATNNQTGCASEEHSVVVLPSSRPVIEVSLSNYFSDNMIVTVNTLGSGDYEYQLGSSAWQDSPVFEHVPSGTYTVTVRDKNGCGQAYTSVLVVDYPKFFTPNGDGYNDYWNIKDLQDQANAYIQIFDRYGKLLYKIQPNGQGWNGKVNGTDLPSTDYWFVVYYMENDAPKEFRSHFSLKR